MLYLCCLLASCLFFDVATGLDRYVTFKSEPRFRVARFDVKTITTDRSLLSPGYVFLTVDGDGEAQAPQILTQDGELVWWGRAYTKNNGDRTQCFAACDYLASEEPHMCWSEGGGHGQNRIFDNHYQQVDRDFYALGSIPHVGGINAHEFNMLPGGRSFIQMLNRNLDWDLTEFDGPSDGVVVDQCFQEVDVAENTPLFSWCYTDHLPVSETDVDVANPNLHHDGAGDGTRQKPWDPMHVNSADKSPDGDFFVSARHLNAIIKVAGNTNPQGKAPGEVLWRLGGKSSDFKLVDDLHFARQHHVRHLSSNATVTTITIFNNDFLKNSEDEVIPSAGLIIDINNSTMEATLNHRYVHPEKNHSGAHGAFQALPNGNFLAGWSFGPGITEFHSNGTVLLHADIEDYDAQGSYRTLKFPWTGLPLQPPRLLIYSRRCTFNRVSSPLMAYVTWNGATEVASWKFRILGPGREWSAARTVPKTGFETGVNLFEDVFRDLGPATVRQVLRVEVEALDANGAALENGKTTAKPFVPDHAVRDQCDVEGCEEFFWYAARHNYCGQCVVGSGRMMLGLFLCLSFIESVNLLWRRLLEMLTDTPGGWGGNSIGLR